MELKAFDANVQGLVGRKRDFGPRMNLRSQSWRCETDRDRQRALTAGAKRKFLGQAGVKLAFPWDPYKSYFL